MIRMKWAVPAAAVLLAATLYAPASAQQAYTEKLYDPPVGSRWSIVAESNATEQRAAGDERSQQTYMRSELTIDEKLASGYRISYVSRDITVSGNTAAARIVGDVFGAMKDVVIRARTDASGKPVEVENLDEVKASLKKVVAAMEAKFQSNPQAGALVRDMLLKAFDVSSIEAARIYLDELPSLAAAQNTRMQPGEVRRENETVPSPFGGGAFKSTLITRLDSFDDKTGKVRFTRKREFDQESLRQAVMNIARQLAGVADKNAITPEVIEAMKKVDFSLESETVYEVDNGMTVGIDEREFTRASVVGTTFTKRQKRTVAVTPLR